MIELLAEPSPDTGDLSSMTKAELLEYAGKHGIEGVSSSMKKAEIYQIITGGNANGYQT